MHIKHLLQVAVVQNLANINQLKKETHKNKIKNKEKIKQESIKEFFIKSLENTKN